MAERSREHALKACIGEWGEAITEALTRALNAEGIEDSDDPILFVSEHLARGRGLVSQQAATIERLRAEVRALKQRTFGAGSGSTNALPVVAAAMPPALRGFAPLASDAAVQAIVPRVRDAEAAAVAGSGVEAAVGQLRAHLAELQAALQAAADARLAHAGIVATCDGVIAAGADFFAGVYREVYATVAQTEADGLAALADALAGAVAGASGDAAQRTSSALALYLDAAAVRPAARALVEEIAGEVEGAQLSADGGLKSTVRMVEKAMLRPDAPGDAGRICDVVRDMIICSSVAQVASLVDAFGRSDRLRIVRIKDRFSTPSAGGWRDVLLNYRLRLDDDARSAHVCEVQIVHRKMLTARKGLDGHAVYGRVRNATEILESLRLDGDDRTAKVAALCAEAVGAGAGGADEGGAPRDAAVALVSRLVHLGLDSAELGGARCFRTSELRRGGNFSADELRAVGVPLGALLRAGYEPSALRCASLDDPGALLAAGYDDVETFGAFDLLGDEKAEARQRAALMCLYHATGGTCWAKADSGPGGQKDHGRGVRWGSDAPIGDWPGVKVVHGPSGASVVYISLPKCGLDGTLPDATFRNLPDLASLNLSENEALRGEVPASLGLCERLGSLNLLGCPRLVLPRTPCRLTAAGFDPMRRTKQDVKRLQEEGLCLIPVGEARLNLREKLGIEWTGSGSLMVRKVFGQAKRLGVQAGWVATGIDGVALKDADDHLDAFKERLAARQAQKPSSASASTYVAIAFCGMPRWEWEDDHRSFQAYKPVRAIALEEAFLRGDDTVESLPGTGGSKYTVDLSTMVQRNKSTKRARSVRRIAALGHGGQAKS